MSLLRGGLEPTDFADADCRISDWHHDEYFGDLCAVRVWVCKCGNGYWFQRHEWQKRNANSTQIDEWIFSGYFPHKKWGDHMHQPEKDI